MSIQGDGSGCSAQGGRGEEGERSHTGALMSSLDPQLETSPKEHSAQRLHGGPSRRVWKGGWQ